jgi:hypothetical protein
MNALTQALNKAGFQAPKNAAFKSGWNAKLSYRTHQALLKDGYTKFSGA